MLGCLEVARRSQNTSANTHDEPPKSLNEELRKRLMELKKNIDELSRKIEEARSKWEEARKRIGAIRPVSYTHLTLPTN